MKENFLLLEMKLERIVELSIYILMNMEIVKYTHILISLRFIEKVK